MNTYKQISIEKMLTLSNGTEVYYKQYNKDNYNQCFIQNNTHIYLELIDVNGRNIASSSALKFSNWYEGYTFYIKVPTYSATEIMQKIESEELQDDDILIDKNRTEDSVYDILEQSTMALKDYAPYQIKERKPIKIYYGDEIIKMIREGKFKHNDRLLGYLSNGEKVAEFIIFKNDNATINIKEVGSYEDDVDSWDLINMKFSIKK